MHLSKFQTASLNIGDGDEFEPRKVFKPHPSHGKKCQFAHEDDLTRCNPNFGGF
jgi:hypothetical protein